MADMLAKMRKALDDYVDGTRPPLPSTRKLFAEHPAESDEILRILFEEYDDGKKPDREIEGLMQLRLTVFLVHTGKRNEALHRQGVLRAAYEYPPDCQRAMYLSLRWVVHNGEAPAQCEALVRSYPGVAQALLAHLRRVLPHASFYSRSGNADWAHARKEIDTLLAMLARAEGQRLLAEMGGAT